MYGVGIYGYGTYLGTGATAVTAGFAYMTTMSTLLVGLSVVMGLVTLASVVRRMRRTGAHQRP